jgi:hypothetical protein
MTCNDPRTWHLYEILYTIAMIEVFLLDVGLAYLGLSLKRFDNDNFGIYYSGHLLLQIHLYCRYRLNNWR